MSQRRAFELLRKTQGENSDIWEKVVENFVETREEGWSTEGPFGNRGKNKGKMMMYGRRSWKTKRKPGKKDAPQGGLLGIEGKIRGKW